MTPRFELATPAARATAPELDAEQQAVVDHPGGPLLVLAGPGTGKTTTLVEAIVERIEGRGARPDQVLALTFGRKAAEQLRDRVTARLGRTTGSAMCATFHSFAYGLLRRYAPAELYAAPLRLLSAPEQDVVIRRLLAEAPDAPETVAWPDGFRAAVETRGFAAELGNFLARARERGLGAEDLAVLGAGEGRPELAAAGRFLAQYLDVLDAESAVDYADLVSRAGVQAELHREQLREQFRYVFVDEFQDTDPSQVALLRSIAGDGRDLVVVGDPDQSIYGFRGAEVRGILDFPASFTGSDGGRAGVIALGTTRRFGARIATAAGRVSAGIGVAGAIDAATLRAFRHPHPAGPEGRVQVCTFDTERAEHEHIADLLRRSHLEDGVDWSQMAVLVRSGRQHLPGLRRSLVAAGVPVEVAADDTPLVREPAVAPLLSMLRIVVAPVDAARLDGQAEGLLLSPLAGLDAVEQRALARALRQREKAAAVAQARPPRSSPELLDEALLDPTMLEDADPAVAKVRRIAALLARAREVAETGGTAEEVLWTLWSGTGWPERLRRTAESGGPGARLAHRDLDAINALFDAAARTEEVRGHTSVENFLGVLQAQELPADTLADRGVRGSAVRLLTAHRAKGLEWDVVVAAHVQEEVWPDLRRRATLLDADRLAPDRLLPPRSHRAMLAEERRLFYVACTRARRRLVVTAVASPEDEGEQPSRFLAELGVDATHVAGRPPRPLSLGGLVADLRRTATDPDSPAALREAAITRLARLAQERIGERALVPQADPGQWWGVRAPSYSPTPLRDPERPISLSASDLQGIDDCALQWFLQREAGGVRETNSSAGFGLVVHALADRVSRGELSASPDDTDALMAYVDQVWDQITFRTPWAKQREHQAVRGALGRFLRWHLAENGRDLLATEQPFRHRVDLPDGEQVELRGFADRLEVGQDGRLVVIDLKTGKYAPTAPRVREHPQLGLYQYAVREGAFADLSEVTESAGAELVQLRAASGEFPKVLRQEPDDVGVETMPERLMDVARMLRSESLQASAGDHCRLCDFEAVCPVKGPGTVFDR